MNLLKNTRCYLAGPIEHDEKATSWRQDVASFLSTLDVKSYDPLVKPQWLDHICCVEPSLYRKALGGCTQRDTVRGREVEITPDNVIEANRMMRLACMRIVHAVDWIICYSPIKYTVGTFEEIFEAIRVGKPVFFCCPEGITSTWLLSAVAQNTQERSEYFFEDWAALKKRIQEIDIGKIKLDPIKWMFMSWREEDWNNPLKQPTWR